MVEATEILSIDQLDTLLKEENSAYLIHFWAGWCPTCTNVDQLLDFFTQQFKNINAILRVEAESFPDITDRFNITSVPAVVSVKNGDALKTVEGFDPQYLRQIATELNEKQGGSAPEDINDLCKRLINQNDIMLFMKGTPDAPRCGFSRQMVELLNKHFIEYGSFDILSDERVRNGLKEYSKWPTYPQLYAKGELIGGLDIVKELDNDNSLLSELQVEDINDLCKRLTNQSEIVLFMKGNPNAPKCGFSRQMVELLKEQGITNYTHFDILSNDRVRSGLKVYSNWPTYPQLYSKGELIGGLDVVKELISSGEFKAELGLE